MTLTVIYDSSIWRGEVLDGAYCWVYSIYHQTARQMLLQYRSGCDSARSVGLGS